MQLKRPPDSLRECLLASTDALTRALSLSLNLAALPAHPDSADSLSECALAAAAAARTVISGTHSKRKQARVTFHDKRMFPAVHQLVHAWQLAAARSMQMQEC